MHLLLTDRLACPRCGPAFGLILLSDRTVDRRVVEGDLGCANCRERYPIREGVADLRPPPRGDVAPPPPAAAAEPDDGELAVAVAAGMGAGDVQRGHALLLGRAGALAPALTAVVPEGVEVVVARGWSRPTGDGPSGFTRIVAGDDLPFFDGAFAGVAVHGDEAGVGRLRAAARVLARGHRVVVIDPPDDVQVRLGGAGLTRFAHGGRVAAAGR